jgi:hypothetical protein
VLAEVVKRRQFGHYIPRTKQMAFDGTKVPVEQRPFSRKPYQSRVERNCRMWNLGLILTNWPLKCRCRN